MSAIVKPVTRRSKRIQDATRSREAYEMQPTTETWIYDDVMIVIFNQVMLMEPKTAVQVLPLVCRRWRQLLRTAVTFQASMFKGRPLLRSTCSVSTVVSRFKTVQSLRMTDFVCVTQHCYTVIANRCPNIVRMHLDERTCPRLRITDTDLTVIVANCHTLFYLDLQCCERITDAGFATINCLRLLIYLDLNRTCITDVGLKAISSGCSCLTYLNLCYCPGITSAGFVAIAQLKSLTYLNIAYSRTITDAELKAIVSGCQELMHLNLCYCEGITDAGFTIINRLTALIYLDLCATLITDDGSMAIISGCRNLIHLDLSYCRRITDAGVATIGHLGSLTHVYVYCTQITDVGLTTIASDCRKLVHLGVNDTPTWDLDDLENVISFGYCRRSYLSPHCRR